MNKKAVIALLSLAALFLLIKRQKPQNNNDVIEQGKAPEMKTENNAPATINKSLPRGIRNNNPLNIEYNAANQWDGQTGTDGRFAQFSDPFFGIRAGAKLLKNYRDKHGLMTPRAIIGRFAPAVENNVQAYVGSVSQRSGLFADMILNDADYIKLIEAMIHHENGQQPYDLNMIAGAVNAGFN